MDIMLLIFIIIMVLIIFFIISIMKKLVKVGLILLAIFIILFLVTGGSIMNDFSKLKSKIAGSPNIVLLENNGKIITGFIDEKKPEPLSQQQIALVDGLYNDNRLEEIKGSNYKLFIIKTGALDGLSIKINNKDVSSSQINDFFIRDIPISSITAEDLTLDVNITADMKTTLFAYLYEKELKMTKSPIFFFKNYKEKNIIVYPETIFFKFTKIIPLSWMEQNLNKLKDSIADKTRDAVTGAATLIKKRG